MASAHRDKPTAKGESRYRVAWRDEYGKQRTKGGFRRKRDAEQWAKTVDVDLARGDHVDPAKGRETFATYAARWLDDQHHLKPKTIHNYRQVVRSRLVPHFGDVPLGRIDARMAQDYFNEQATRYAAWTLRETRVVARRIMGDAVREGLVKTNPFAGIRLKQPPKKPTRILKPAQVDNLAAALPHRHGMLVRFAAYTGLRAAELAALRVGDLTPDLATVHVTRSLVDVGGTLTEGPTKTNASRTVGVPATLRDDLRAHLADAYPDGYDADAWLFPGPRGGPHRHTNFYRRHFRPAVAQALPDELHTLTFHDLRHTCAALLIGLGAHPKEIAERLGHSSITVTMDTYGHIFPDRHDALTHALDEELRRGRESNPRPIA